MKSSPAPPAVADRIGVGITSMVCAVFFFSLMDTLAKWLGQSYEAVQIVFLRYAIGMLPVALLVWRSGGLAALRTRRPGLHALRAGLLFVAILSFFHALRSLPLADAIAAAFTAPLFITALSAPLLGETVGRRRWSAVAIGFVGALVMLRPGTDAFQPAALLVLFSALAFSLMVLLTRRLTRTETNAALVTYGTAGAGLASLPFALLVWRAPAGPDLWLFAVLGFIGGLAALLVVHGYRNAPVSVLAPFEYTALIWGALLGWIIWRDQPAAPVWVGAAVICAAGLYITHREVRRGIRRPEPPAPPPG